MKVSTNKKGLNMGRWIGKGRWAFSTEEKDAYRREKQRKFEERINKWKSINITIWRLKKERFWTDSMIKEYLGEPLKEDKYKFYKIEDVKKAERKKIIKEKLNDRKNKITKKHYEKHIEDPTDEKTDMDYWAIYCHKKYNETKEEKYQEGYEAYINWNVKNKNYYGE
jgi:hypothetical protein